LKYKYVCKKILYSKEGNPFKFLKPKTVKQDDGTKVTRWLSLIFY